MSFGFGVGDFLTVIDKAKAIIEACRDGPSDFRELSREVDTLQITILHMKQDYEDPTSLLTRKGQSREKDMKQITDNCQDVLDEIQTFVNKHKIVAEPASASHPVDLVKRTWHDYKVGSADLDDVRGKLTFYTSTIDLFLDSLSTAALGRIEHKVDFIIERLMAPSAAKSSNAKSVLSLASPTPDGDAWNALRSELVAAGVSSSDMECHKERILAYVQGLIADELSEAEITSRIRESYSSSMSSPSKPDSQQSKALHEVNLFLMEDLYIRQPITFLITTIQYGVYASQPACLIVINVLYRSTIIDKLTSGHFSCALRTGQGKADPQLSVIAYAPKDIRGKQWSLFAQPTKDKGSIIWSLFMAERADCPSQQQVKLALIIRHLHESFSVSIQRTGTLKSIKNSLKVFGSRKENTTFFDDGGKPINLALVPEENESVLDDIDLEAVTAVHGSDI